MTISIKSNNDGTGSIYVGNNERIKIYSDGTVDNITNSGTTNLSPGPVMLNSGPCFSASLSASTALSSAVYTKVNFGNEEWDTDDCYNPSTSRFTPNVAGYYYISAMIQYNGTVTGILGIFVNGSNVLMGDFHNTAYSDQVRTVFGMVYLNGTTDYVEIHAYSGGAASSTTYPSNANFQKFTGFLVHT